MNIKENVVINNDFILNIKQPLLYTESSDEKELISIFMPPKDYDEVENNYNFDKNQATIMFNIMFNGKLDPEKLKTLDFKNMLQIISDNSEKSFVEKYLSNEQPLLVHGDYEKVVKVIRDNPNLKVGYYTMRCVVEDNLLLGSQLYTKYIGLIMTDIGYYVFNSKYNYVFCNAVEVKNQIEELLNSIELINSKRSNIY